MSEDRIWAEGIDEESGEDMCDKCRGRGVIFIGDRGEIITSGFSSGWKLCPKCEGNGKVDWARRVRTL